jgi:hypothetical protein
MPAVVRAQPGAIDVHGAPVIGRDHAQKNALALPAAGHMGAPQVPAQAKVKEVIEACRQRIQDNAC